jgi:hypothetical protein
MELNGSQWLLVYADDVNILGENINTIQKNSSAEASRHDGLERKHRIYYILPTECRAHNSVIAHKSFENVVKFKYLKMSVTNKNCIHKEIKS